MRAENPAGYHPTKSNYIERDHGVRVRLDGHWSPRWFSEFPHGAKETLLGGEAHK